MTLKLMHPTLSAYGKWHSFTGTAVVETLGVRSSVGVQQRYGSKNEGDSGMQSFHLHLEVDRENYCEAIVTSLDEDCVAASPLIRLLKGEVEEAEMGCLKLVLCCWLVKGWKLRSSRWAPTSGTLVG